MKTIKLTCGIEITDAGIVVTIKNIPTKYFELHPLNSRDLCIYLKPQRSIWLMTSEIDEYIKEMTMMQEAVNEAQIFLQNNNLNQ